MIPPRIQHVIDCLARYEAIQRLKNHPNLAEKLYNGAKFEDADYEIVGAVRRKIVKARRQKKPRPRF